MTENPQNYQKIEKIRLLLQTALSKEFKGSSVEDPNPSADEQEILDGILGDFSFDIMDGETTSPGISLWNELKNSSPDLWFSEQNEDLQFAISLLLPNPPANLLPKMFDNGTSIALLFVPVSKSKEIFVLELNGQEYNVRSCKNSSWEDELNTSDQKASRIVVMPSDKLPDNKMVLLCKIRIDLSSIDLVKQQLRDFRLFFDFKKSRHVLFESSGNLSSLQKNEWWEEMADNGRFHIVLCNIDLYDVMKTDFAQTPRKGSLQNFVNQGKVFFPYAWRHFP